MADPKLPNGWLFLSGDAINALSITRVARDRDGRAVIHFLDGGWMRTVEYQSNVLPLVFAAIGQRIQKAQSNE